MTRIRLLLIAIFLLGFVLRFWYIAQAPPRVNRDEAAIGYTSYSLSLTGKDEYGVLWPISFKSFGDWKLPFYIYLAIPFIKIFGLTDTAVRLPSVIFGSVTIIVTYFLVKELFQNKTKLPLLAGFFFAVSPWSIHISRTASEANLAALFTSMGILLFLKSFKSPTLLVLSAVSFALSLYTYHANHIFTPLLFIVLLFLFWRKQKYTKSWWLALATFFVLSLAIYSQTLLAADKTKISGLFPTADQAIIFEKVTTDRLEHSETPKILANLLHNKFVFATLNTLQNYAKSFSPEFLFITGGGNQQHNIPDFGNLYLWEAPFLLLGLAYLLVSSGQNKFIMLAWLVVAPVAASITKDAPHTARMAPVLPLLEIMIAFGVFKFITKLNLLNIILLAAFIANFLIWNDRYFIHFPYKRAAMWGEGYKKLVSYLRENNNFDAREVVMSRPEYSPYIYFLFYNKVDPLHFQNSAIRYPETSEGFQHLAKFDNYNFRQIDWSDDLAIPDRLYIEWSEQLPPSATESSTLITKELMSKLVKNNKEVANLQIGDTIKTSKIGDIKLQNGVPMFTLVKTSKLTKNGD